MKFYKVTIEELDSENRADFYVKDQEPIEHLLSHEYFNLTFTDAKTAESFTIKRKVFEGLKITNNQA